MVSECSLYKMKFLRWRSYSYVVAMLLVALLLGWAGRVTWQELRQLHRSFDSIQREAFQLSDHITAAVGDLNHLVQNFNQYGAPEDRVAFQMRSERLRQWIHTHLPNVTTTRERELIGQIDSKLEVYLTTAQRLERETSGGGVCRRSAIYGRLPERPCLAARIAFRANGFVVYADRIGGSGHLSRCDWSATR